VNTDGRAQLRDSLKRRLKLVRDWSLLNVPVTSALRAAVRRTGRDPAFLVRYVPRVGVVEATLPNDARLRLWSKGDDDVASAVFWRGWLGHESETSAHFFDLARSAGVTIDIGAHVGYFSLLAGLANPNGIVYAFEPLDAVYARLRRNVALNDLSNVRCEKIALGRQSGTAEFFHVADSIPSSSSFSREFMESIVAEERLVASTMAVTTLDQFLAERHVTGVDLVKVDTESTENDVLAGMLETLDRDRPRIICEVLPNGPAREIEETLRPFGYRFALFTDNGLVATEHIEPHSIWRNFLFSPPNR
jgi:FkbM family methyltransferase